MCRLAVPVTAAARPRTGGTEVKSAIRGQTKSSLASRMGTATVPDSEREAAGNLRIFNRIASPPLGLEVPTKSRSRPGGNPRQAGRRSLTGLLVTRNEEASLNRQTPHGKGPAIDDSDQHAHRRAFARAAAIESKLAGNSAKAHPGPRDTNHNHDKNRGEHDQGLRRDAQTDEGGRSGGKHKPADRLFEPIDVPVSPRAKIVVESVSQLVYETMHVPAPIAWNSSPRAPVKPDRSPADFRRKQTVKAKKRRSKSETRISAQCGARSRLMGQHTARSTADVGRAQSARRDSCTRKTQRRS